MILAEFTIIQLEQQLMPHILSADTKDPIFPQQLHGSKITRGQRLAI